MRLPHVAIVIMLCIAAVQAAYYYPQLPAIVAGHFGASGAPNAWQSKSAFFELFGFVYALMAFVFFAMPHLIMSVPPAFINLPNKAYWLSPERRHITAHRVADAFAWFGVAQIAFLILLCQLAINANLAGSTRVLSPAIWWIVGLFLAFAVIWAFRFYRTFASRASV